MLSKGRVCMKRRRSLYLFVSFFVFLLLGAGIGAAQAAAPLKIMLDGVPVQTDVSPYVDNNSRTMVPVRLISEALGCYVEWNSAEQRVRLSLAEKVVELYIGRRTAFVDAVEQEMDTVAVIKERRTMVPLRFLAETFGLKVDWQQEQRTIALQSPPPPPPPQPLPGAEAPRIATVNAHNVNIRPGPGTQYEPPLTRVDKGTRLTVLAQEGDWFQVELPQGGKGWIAGWLVVIQRDPSYSDTVLREFALPPGATRAALVMKDTVNVRSGPGVDHEIVGRLSLGQQVAILNEHHGWFEVCLPEGGSGWLAGRLVAVRYDVGKQSPAADSSRVAALLSRWSPGGEQDPGGELSVINGIEVERSGQGVLLKISASKLLGMPASFRLENPSRLVFDFSASLAEAGAPAALEVGYGPVARVRLGRFNEGTVRVVADLQGPASYALTRDLTGGQTVTIQIQPVDPHGKIIVVDPGHGAFHDWGGSDPGAIGTTGLKERDVVRNISLELGHILLNEGYTVIYTRQGDTSLTLEERAAVASISGAELLVSIHANASTNRATSGTMTFYHLEAGRPLAGYIQAELLHRLKREDKGVRQANFVVLRSCPIPAALVEVAYISNPEEERLLADPTFQRRAAEAIALGIKRYLSSR